MAGGVVDPVAGAILASWSLAPLPILALAATTALYLRGFAIARRRLPARFPAWRRTAFLAGIGALALALLSPLDAFADLLLQVHMAQHWLLMMVAPPLVWLGAPLVPLLRGLPQSALRRGLAPFLAWRGLRRALRWSTRPAPAWLAWALTTVAWHLPVAYQAALRSRAWHDLEHASFLAASLLFWYPIVAPWPERRAPGRGALVLGLGLAAVFNTLFSAVFAFSTRPFYPAYAAAPRPWGVDALADQNAAGALMWAAASLPMLIAAVAILFTWLEPAGLRGAAAAHTPAAPPRPARAPAARARARWPESLGLRRALQGLMLALAAAFVADGLWGAQQPAALNLAGVLPWTYWRGLAVIGLLVAGNAVCAACPFTLSRGLAGRWLGHRLRWPAALRNKWLAAGLFAAFLLAYEVFALWDSPWWTAWIAIGYFAACFAVEGLFPRGTFCRHVCPIGQFQFAGSGVSPLEVRALDATTCASCRSHDCLRGNATRPGCPTGLFLPTKRGGLDCTFCLDCVRACPHDNAGVRAVAPGAALGRGRAAGADVAALLLLFSFGAFANAAAMVAPVADWERGVAAWLGAGSTRTVAALGLVAALLLVPAAACWLAALASQRLSGLALPPRALGVRFAPALVPLGFAMWLAHFGFHLGSGIGSLAPAAARAARALGVKAADALASVSPPAVDPASLTGFEIAALGVGLVVCFGVGWRIACETTAAPARALRVAAPWALLAVLLYLLGVWIALQPMEMRGMVMP